MVIHLIDVLAPHVVAEALAFGECEVAVGPDDQEVFGSDVLAVFSRVVGALEDDVQSFDDQRLERGALERTDQVPEATQLVRPRSEVVDLSLPVLDVVKQSCSPASRSSLVQAGDAVVAPRRWSFTPPMREARNPAAPAIW